MLCTHALLDPGDEVLVPSPGFLLYYSSIPMLHAVPVPYVLKEPDYDWDGAPVSDRTKLMIFNNPNNPTGKVFSAEEMRDAADFVKKHDLLAISDEAYDRLLYGDAKHRSLGRRARHARTHPPRRLAIQNLFHDWLAARLRGWRAGTHRAPGPPPAELHAQRDLLRPIRRGRSPQRPAGMRGNHAQSL